MPNTRIVGNNEPRAVDEGRQRSERRPADEVEGGREHSLGDAARERRFAGRARQHDAQAACGERIGDDGEALGVPAARRQLGARMNAHVAAARQAAVADGRAELLAVGRLHGRLQLEPGRRRAERRQQPHAALDFGLVVAPRQKARRIRAVLPFAEEARHAASAEQRDERIADLAAAVQLQRQIEAPLLRLAQEVERRPRLAAALGQARKAGKLDELIYIGREPRGELARPR